jgi:hypothetical protein
VSEEKEKGKFRGEPLGGKEYGGGNEIEERKGL